MSAMEESGLSRLRKMGQRLLRSQGQRTNARAQPIPGGVAGERRSGRRVPLPLDVRVKLKEDDDPRTAKIRDVNMTGFALEPAYDADREAKVIVGFDGFPDVCPAFAIVGTVKRVLDANELETVSAMGVEIDRDLTSAEAQKNFRRLVRHYLQHRPLLDEVRTGFFKGRCASCSWAGQVGERKPQCPRCGATVGPLREEAP